MLQTYTLTTSHRLAGKICLFRSYHFLSATLPGCDWKSKIDRHEILIILIIHTWKKAVKINWTKTKTLIILLYLVLLNSGIMDYPKVVVNIKMKQWPALTPGFRDYEIVKRIILAWSQKEKQGGPLVVRAIPFWWILGKASPRYLKVPVRLGDLLYSNKGKG